MAPPTLPTELIYNVVSEARPPEGWGRYWPLTRSVEDVKAFLALRLVCKDLNHIVLDYFSVPDVILEEFDSACLQRCDPPTPGALQMCRRLLTWHLERSPGRLVNDVSLAFRSQLLKIVDAAVTVLRDSNPSTDVDELRAIYTRGLATAVIGFSGCAKSMEGIAGVERQKEDDEDDEEDEDAIPVPRSKPDQQELLNMALTTAATLGRIDDMNVLIEKGADPQYEGEGQWIGSALHGSAIGGHVDAMDLAMEDVKDTERESNFSQNEPIHYAAMYGHLEAVKWLASLNRGPDPRNEDDQTPLFFAASSGRADIVKELMDHDYSLLKIDGEDIPLGREDLWDRLHSENSGDDDSVDDVHMEDDSSEDNPYRISNLVDICAINIEADDYRGRTPLMMAVQRGYYDVVNELMWRNEVKINNRNSEEFDMSLLAIAASKGYERIFRLLLQHPEIKRYIRDSSGHGVLKHAASGGNVNIVKEILTWRDVDVNQPGADNSTPIMWAALYGHEDIVRLLIDKGAAVNLVTHQLHLQMINYFTMDDGENTTPSPQLMGAVMGRTAVLVGASALDAAAHGGHEGIVKLLIERDDVEPDAEDIHGRTPLANAALTGNAGVVKLLLAHDDVTSVMSRDHEGYTPLMLAARSGDANVVRVLLEDPNVPDPSVAINLSDDKGDTALVHAAKQGHRSVVERLLRHPKIDTSGALAGAAGQNRKDIVHLLLDRKIVTSKLEVERALDAAKKNMERDMHAFLMPYLHIMPEN